MFEKLKKLKALSGAERTLEARAKLSKAIATEEAKLLKLIIERVEADHALIEAETSAVLEEEADVAGARKRVDSVMAAITRQAAVLGGLRSRMAAQAGELEAELRAITAALPEHISALQADFESTWRHGAAAFGKLLGERRALEAIAGKMDLPEPQPVAVELEAAAAPWQAITALRAGIEVVAGFGRAASAPAVDAMRPGGARAFDPTEVYVLTATNDVVPAGSLVMESCFAPGWLHHLVNVHSAESLTSQNWAATTAAGQRAAASIESEAQQSAFKKADAEQEAAVQAMPTPPIAGQRPDTAETAYERDWRELAASHRPDPTRPENIGTVVG